MEISKCQKLFVEPEEYSLQSDFVAYLLQMRKNLSGFCESHFLNRKLMNDSIWQEEKKHMV